MLGAPVYTEVDEWPYPDHIGYTKDDPVRHIELRKAASALLIAPISANTMAKMAYGLCDNLLTSVARAWDYTRPVIVAPAMNTMMWHHPSTEEHLHKIKSWGAQVVPPVSKILACKDQGEGAMAQIDDILEMLRNALRWVPPLYSCNGLPVGNHPGSFGVKRKYSHHTGLDLYTAEGVPVYAVEGGRVIKTEHFTGPQDNSPWWNDTEAILIEGPTGVVCYGEVEPVAGLWRDHPVKKGQHIAQVKRVLKEGKERPDIPGHSTSMLHFELYPHGTKECSKSWKLDKGKPDGLLNPTPYLLETGWPELKMPLETP